MKFYVLLAALAILASCKHAATDQEAASLASSTVQSGPLLATIKKIAADPTREFFDGLLAAPSSPERKKSGLILEILVEDAYKKAQGKIAKMDKDVRKYFEDDLKVGYAHFMRTVTYLKTGNQCLSGDKIRVYRGYGNQALLAKNPQAAEKMHLFGTLEHVLKEALKAKGVDISRTSVNPGLELYQNIGKLGPDFIVTGVDWKYFLGIDRESRDGEIDMMWSQITATHTLTSDDSLLISTSLKADVPYELGFGPNYLVLDICPERAIPLESSFAFGEAEVYVPFFILPEEFRRTEGADCGLKIAQGAARETCNPDFRDVDPLTINTQSYRHCYFNTGNPVEYKAYSSAARSEIVSARYDALVSNEGMKKVYGATQSIEAVRKDMASLVQLCKIDCILANKIVGLAEQDLASLAHSTDPVDVADAKFFQGYLADYKAQLAAPASALGCQSSK